MASKFSPREVCIANSFDSTDFIFLFCLQDPVTASNFVRKCCDTGYLMNQTSQLCEPSSNVNFSVDYRNENGQNVTLSNNLPIRSGIKPSFDHRIFLDPDSNKRGKFYILPNGTVYVPGFLEGSRVLDDYCVDDFKIDDKIVSCFTTVQIDYNYNRSIINLGEKSSDEKILAMFLKGRIFYSVGTFISSIFYVATFVVYAIIPELRNTPGANVMCYVASTATTYISFGIVNLFMEIVTLAAITGNTF